VLYYNRCRGNKEWALWDKFMTMFAGVFLWAI